MLVVFEGHDGVGKTSLVAATASVLNAQNISTLTMRCPPDRLTRERSEVARSEDLGSLLHFYTRAAALVCQDYEGRADENSIVLCDRYIYSTLALGGACTGAIPWERATGLRTPDLGLWIVVPESVRLDRLSMRGGRSDHEIPDPRLIQKADHCYAGFGLMSISNEAPLRDVSARVAAMIVHRRSHDSDRKTDRYFGPVLSNAEFQPEHNDAECLDSNETRISNDDV